MYNCVTRFPPEPNGYLHIGHAKAINFNFNYAAKHNGICYLRFDDTNPSNEKNEYIESIISDVKWLGFKPHKVTYTSDYFSKLYDLALKLIDMDKAYICICSPEKISEKRYNKESCSCRTRSKDESTLLFGEMSMGTKSEKDCVLRLKANMTSDNPSLRDPVAYRVSFKKHHRTGDEWCVYPTYDYSHSLVDSLEGITESFCSMEFQTRNVQYRWIQDTLQMRRSNQIEYSRLNITHTILSKRKLTILVEKGIVDGWDDPRMPTISGLRRRGYTPTSINNFCSKAGINIGGSGAYIEYKVLEQCLREDLEQNAKRIMCVLDPIKVTIVNWTDGDNVEIDYREYPNRKDSSTHTVKFGKHIYIDRNDFREIDSKKYYRLAPNKIVRLRYAFPIICKDYKKDNDGNVTEILAEYLPDYTKRIRGIIHWVPDNGLRVTIKKYDHIFPEKIDPNRNWIEQLNRDSLKAINGIIDPDILNGKRYDHYQLERVGYCLLDSDLNSEFKGLEQSLEQSSEQSLELVDKNKKSDIVLNYSCDLKESKYKNL